MMNIIYSSDNYYVVEYPTQHGYELVDKHSRRGTFFQGDVADRFGQSLHLPAGATEVLREPLPSPWGREPDLILPGEDHHSHAACVHRLLQKCERLLPLGHRLSIPVGLD